jgi:hypothetical protein
MSCFRHGDDFVTEGTRKDLTWFAAELNKHLIANVKGVLGPRTDLGDAAELSVLNRIIRWIPHGDEGGERIEVEGDPRHVEILAFTMGLTMDSNPVSSPGVKPKNVESTAKELNEEGRTKYRSVTMRMAYLAQDRPDLQYTCKELARKMQSPNEDDMLNLKRAVRYAIGVPRVVVRFKRQRMRAHLDVYSDSDAAGCLRTRKSTSSTIVMHGDHCIRTSSTTQGVIALSSGEAEFYALVKSSSIGIGSIAIAADLGVPNMQLRVHTDATAGKGIAQRIGAGKVRHIHTPALWIQKAVAENRVKLFKVLGTENPADAGTKYLNKVTLWIALNRIGVHSIEGRSTIAPRAQLATENLIEGQFQSNDDGD